MNPFDPNFDPAADLEASGQIISAAASIDVTPPPTLTVVPEPWSLTLLATVLGLMAFQHRGKRLTS